nr:methyltransferase C-terminal domain-containing protein [Mycobacterium sp. 852014-52144_SCH5372336]
MTQGQFDVISHTHRSYLSLCSLDRVLERHGLRVVAARCVDDFGGTVRVLATGDHDGTSIPDNGLEADEIRRIERTARVDEAAGYAGLAERVRTACAELIEFLDEARRSGRTVVGYGASSRGTVLLNLADADAELLPFVVDRSEAKQGRRLPRSQIPIRPVAELERQRPDYVMILPWPSANQIIRYLQDALGAHTRYVMALPHLEVL